MPRTRTLAAARTRKAALISILAATILMTSNATAQESVIAADAWKGVKPGEGVCKSIKPQAANFEGATSYVYKTAKRPLYLHVFSAKPEPSGSPAIIFYFGGAYAFGNIEQFLDQAKALRDKGVTAILADYRVACRDGTERPDSDLDAQEAFQWVFDHSKQLDLNREQIVVSGGSAGGGVALATAAAKSEGRPAALVLFNPDPRPMPLQPLPPMLIMHGQADTKIPIKLVRELCAVEIKLGATCTLVEYPGREHGFFNSKLPEGIDPATISRPEDYKDTLEEAIQFLKRLDFIGGDTKPGPAVTNR